jgi:hypothetical protein
MSVREKLNDGRVGVTVGVVFIVFALAIGVWYFKPAARPDPYSAYYSDDDGQTYFQDSLFRFPPFDHNGKTAVMAELYQDTQGHRFVGYLLRYVPQTQKKLEDKYAQAEGANQAQTMLGVLSDPSVGVAGMEMKFPGADKKWTPYSHNLYPSIVAPDGDHGTMPVEGN